MVEYFVVFEVVMLIPNQTNDSYVKLILVPILMVLSDKRKLFYAGGKVLF